MLRFATFLAVLSLCSALQLPNGFVRSTTPTRHAPVRMFDFKKMIDPEGAMERNVFANELSGKGSAGDKEAYQKRKKEEQQAKTRARKSGFGNNKGPDMPNMFASMPNPFGKN